MWEEKPQLVYSPCQAASYGEGFGNFIRYAATSTDDPCRAVMENSGAQALLWVDALNSFDHGRGILGHHDWQLPSTPQFDSTNCSSNNNGTFGLLCSGNGLGNLYNVGLNRTFPDGVVPHFTSVIWPFRNL